MKLGDMFKGLRLLAMLRRIARALESLAQSQQELAEAARNRRLAREARAARKPGKTEIGVMDLKAAEERHRKMHPELYEEFEEPDDAA
jgi:hypothetical protein